MINAFVQMLLALQRLFTPKLRFLLAAAIILLLVGGTIFFSWSEAQSPAAISNTISPTASSISIDEFSKELKRASIYGGKSGKLPMKGVDLIKEFEGFFPNAYPDSLWGWVVPTIGWGATQKADGSHWHKGDKITLQQADELLESQLDEDYLPKLQDIPHWEEMSANQQGAMLSFGYNVGANFYNASGFKTISSALKEKNWKKIPQILTLYRNPGSIVESGLLRRRKAEGRLFSEVG